MKTYIIRIWNKNSKTWSSATDHYGIVRQFENQSLAELAATQLYSKLNRHWIVVSCKS